MGKREEMITKWGGGAVNIGLIPCQCFHVETGHRTAGTGLYSSSIQDLQYSCVDLGAMNHSRLAGKEIK